jgi:hypothetical protein
MLLGLPNCVDGYVITGYLGHGGGGRVVKARKDMTDYALKFVNVVDTENIDRYMHEVQRLSITPLSNKR